MKFADEQFRFYKEDGTLVVSFWTCEDCDHPAGRHTEDVGCMYNDTDEPCGMCSCQKDFKAACNTIRRLEYPPPTEITPQELIEVPF